MQEIPFDPDDAGDIEDLRAEIDALKNAAVAKKLNVVLGISGKNETLSLTAGHHNAIIRILKAIMDQDPMILRLSMHAMVEVMGDWFMEPGDDDAPPPSFDIKTSTTQH